MVYGDGPAAKVHVSIFFKPAENGDNTEIFNDHNHNKTQRTRH